MKGFSCEWCLSITTWMKRSTRRDNQNVETNAKLKITGARCHFVTAFSCAKSEIIRITRIFLHCHQGHTLLHPINFLNRFSPPKQGAQLGNRLRGARFPWKLRKQCVRQILFVKTPHATKHPRMSCSVSSSVDIPRMRNVSSSGRLPSSWQGRLPRQWM